MTDQYGWPVFFFKKHRLSFSCYNLTHSPLKRVHLPEKILGSLLFKMSVIPNGTTAVYNRFGEIIRQKPSVIHSFIRALCRRLTAYYPCFCLQAPYTSIFSDNMPFFFLNELTGNCCSSSDFGFPPLQ